jgi:hypothetical protein
MKQVVLVGNNTFSATASWRPVPTSGLTLAGMSRIVMAALILFGTYIGMLFPVEWGNLPAVNSGINTPPPAAPQPAAPAVVAQIPGEENAVQPKDEEPPPPPQPAGAPCTDLQLPVNGNSMKGIYGRVYAWGTNSQVLHTVLNVRINLLDETNPAVVVSTTTTAQYEFAGGGQYAFYAERQRFYILEFEPVSTPNPNSEPLKMYYNYFDANAVVYGRYSPKASSTIYLDADCFAYARVDKDAIPAGVNFATEVFTDAQRGTFVKLRSGEAYNGPVAQGRGMGGRLFVGDGTTAGTEPLYTSKYPNLTPNAHLIPLVGNTITSTGIISVIVDAEGYYNVAGNSQTSSGVIPSNSNSRWIIEGRAGDVFLPSYYCNYVLPDPNPDNRVRDFQLSRAVSISFNIGDPQKTQRIANYNPPSEPRTRGEQPAGTPPCISTDTNNPLGKVPGYHFVLRSNKSITGVVKEEGAPATVLPGATVIALLKSTGAEETRVTTNNNGAFTLDKLRAGTEYIIKIIPPESRRELIGEYYNNVSIDTPFATLTAVSTPAATGPVSLALGSEIVLSKGGFIQGTANLNGVAGLRSIRWELYRLVDLQSGTNANPTPLSSGNVNENTGAYATERVMIPGEKYVLNFVPFGNSDTFKSGWCGTLTGNNCTPVRAYDEAVQFSFSGTGNLGAGITANITLFNGVVIQGIITGRTTGGATTNLNVPIFIYVYKVEILNGVPVSPTFAQRIELPSLNAATVNYQTPALFENTNYVLRFVPSVQENIPAFGAAYYDSIQLRGRPELDALSEVVSSTSVGPLPGKNIDLVQAGGFNVKVLTSKGQDYPNVRVEAYKMSEIPGTVPARAADVTDGTGRAQLNGLFAASGPYKLVFTPFNIRGSATLTNQNSTDGIFSSIVYTMPEFAAFYGLIFPAAGEWADTKLIVKSVDGQQQQYNNSTPDGGTGIFKIEKTSGAWYWDAFLPPGTYYFALRASNPAYLRHWYIAARSRESVIEEKAVPVTVLNEGGTSPAMSIEFFLGGLLKIKVIDQETGQALPNVRIGFFRDNTFTQNSVIYTDTTATNGFAGSGAITDTQLWVKADPEVTGAPAEPGTLGPVIAPNGAITSLTLALKPTPSITGTVKIRNTNNTETIIPGVEIETVSSATGAKLNLSPILANGNGIYTARVPNVPFKLKFVGGTGSGSVKMPEDRYWTDSPLQNGSLSIEQATVIDKNNPNYRKRTYNLIFDRGTTPPSGCKVTDLFLKNVTNNLATIRYNTNCPGTTLLGYSLNSANPSAVVTTAYTLRSVEKDLAGVFEHEETIGGLVPGNRYYVRAFSRIVAGPVEVGKMAASAAELLVLPLNDDKVWYFANGRTGVGTTVSNKETIHLMNPSPSQQAVVRLKYYASVATNELVINMPPNSRRDINVHDPADPYSLANPANGGVRAAHATVISSNLSIVVEKTQNSSGQIPYNAQNFSGGFTIPAANTPVDRWVFSGIFVKPSVYQEIILFNPNPQEICIQVNYYRPNNSNTAGFINKASASAPLRVPAFTRVSFAVNGGQYGLTAADMEGATQTGLLLTGATSAAGCNSGGFLAETEVRYAEVSSIGYEKGLAGLWGARDGSQRWHFLDNVHDSTYSALYQVVNMFNTQATGLVTFTALIDNPGGSNLSIVRQFTTTVKALKAGTFNLPFGSINRPVGGVRQGYTLMVESDVPIVVQREIKYLYAASPEMRGMYQEYGSTRANKTFIMLANDTTSDVAQDLFNTPSFTVFNPDSKATTIDLTYYYTITNGSLITPTTKVIASYPIAAYGRVRINPALVNSGSPGLGTNKQFALRITTPGSGVFIEKLSISRRGTFLSGNGYFPHTPFGF